MPGVLLAVRRVGTSTSRRSSGSSTCCEARGRRAAGVSERRRGPTRPRSPASTCGRGTTPTRTSSTSAMAERTIAAARRRWRETLDGEEKETWVLETAGRIAGYAPLRAARRIEGGRGDRRALRRPAGTGRRCGLAAAHGGARRASSHCGFTRRDALGVRGERPRAALLRESRLAARARRRGERVVRELGAGGRLRASAAAAAASENGRAERPHEGA